MFYMQLHNSLLNILLNYLYGLYHLFHFHHNNYNSNKESEYIEETLL